MSAQDARHGAALPEEPAACECDVLVLGSGAGGLSAALASALRGLQTIVAEKSAFFGGTTAWSGGWIWVPCNPIAEQGGVPDSLEDARLYLSQRLGAQYDAALVDAYLGAGPRMVAEYMARTAVQFEGGGFIFPDYYTDTPGALKGAGQSRSLRTAALDGRALRARTLSKLQPMLPQLTAGGMLIGSLVEARHFIDATRSLQSAAFVARKTARYLADRLVYGRDMSLVNGMALVARHALALDELGVPIWVNAPAVELLREQGRVCGAWLACDGKRILVRARRGVVLACGGFPHDEARKRRFYSHVAAGGRHFAVAPTSCTGDGLTLGESAGGEVAEGRPWNCLFMPVSRLARAGAEPAVFPHIWDRSKPGFIAVTPQGRRFVNEATSYMQFGQAMVHAAEGSADVRAWLICDAAAIQRYGLGVVRPMLPLRPHIRSGYLRRGSSIEELAGRIGVPAAQLVQTVAEYNEDAARGTDRGSPRAPMRSPASRETLRSGPTPPWRRSRPPRSMPSRSSAGTSARSPACAPMHRPKSSTGAPACLFLACMRRATTWPLSWAVTRWVAVSPSDLPWSSAISRAATWPHSRDLRGASRRRPFRRRTRRPRRPARRLPGSPRSGWPHS